MRKIGENGFFLRCIKSIQKNTEQKNVFRWIFFVYLVFFFRCVKYVFSRDENWNFSLKL